MDATTAYVAVSNPDASKETTGRSAPASDELSLPSDAPLMRVSAVRTGAELLTVTVALGPTSAEALPTVSCAMPAASAMFTEPEPLHVLNVTVGDAVVPSVTVIVHNTPPV